MWRTEGRLPGVKLVTVPNPIPVEVVGVANGLTIVPQPQQSGLPQVTVQAQVPSDQLGSVSVTWFRATINVANQKAPGTQLYPVEVTSLEPGVTAVSVVPSALPVTLDVITMRSLPVDVQYQGNLPSGYTHTPAVLDTSTVTIRGPNTVLQQIASVIAVVRLDNRKSNFHDTAALIPQNAQGGDVPTDDLQLSPKTVGVNVNVQQPSTTRAVAVVPHITGQPAAGYVVAGITVAPAEVTLVGNPSVLQAAPSALDTAAVDLTNATTTITRTVSLQSPKNTSLVGDAKAQVTVLVAAVPASAIVTVAPTVAGAGNNAVHFNVSSVNITLQGPAALLKTIQPSDITVTIDVTGLSPGQHDVTPAVTVPTGLAVTALQPKQIRVTVIPPTPTATPVPTHTPAPTVTGGPTGLSGPTASLHVAAPAATTAPAPSPAG